MDVVHLSSSFGPGPEPMARTYAIKTLAEAQAYVSHPVLGPRLIECTRVLAALSGRTAHDVVGATDAMKLRSSMTLFARAAPDNPLFEEVLDHYYGGVGDAATEALLEREQGPSGLPARPQSLAGRLVTHPYRRVALARLSSCCGGRDQR